MLRVFLLGLFILAGSFASAFESEFDKMENHLLEGGTYRLDEVFPNVTSSAMKEWPKEVRQSMYLKLWQPGFSAGVDENDPSRFTRFPSPGYEYSGHIVRTMIAEVEGQTVYIAIYFVIGGEIGRDQRFYEYYFLNEKGELFASGRAG